MLVSHVLYKELKCSSSQAKRPLRGIGPAHVMIDKRMNVIARPWFQTDICFHDTTKHYGPSGMGIDKKWPLLKLSKKVIYFTVAFIHALVPYKHETTTLTNLGCSSRECCHCPLCDCSVCQENVLH